MTESSSSEPDPKPPSLKARLFGGAIWAVTAVVLIWIGLVLPADSADAMDGFQRLVFTVIPIRPFAWIMAVVFLGIAVRVLVSKDPPPSE